MKKIIIISTLAGLATFTLGIACGWHGCESYHRVDQANLNTIHYKIEVIKAQRAALEAADKVMDNNELFDADGSDIMCDYLDKAAVVDSLYKLEQQVNPTALLILWLREHKERF